MGPVKIVRSAWDSLSATVAALCAFLPPPAASHGTAYHVPWHEELLNSTRSTYQGVEIPPLSFPKPEPCHA